MRRDYGQHENVEALRDRLARRREVIAVALKEQERSLRQIENALGGFADEHAGA